MTELINKRSAAIKGIYTSYKKYLFVVSLAIVALLAVTGRAAIATQLDQWQVLPRPQSVTELYFTSNQNLPQVIQSGVPQQINFTIHNEENQPILYRYTLVAQSVDNGSTQLLAEGKEQLAHDQTKKVSQKIDVPNIGNHLQIIVNIEYANRQAGDSEMKVQRQSISHRVNFAEGQS